MPKIYTRTGDAGETSLYGGGRVSKSSLRIEAIGAVDEANAGMGAVRSDRHAPAGESRYEPDSGR
jgi:cob(I)alamin adenosyltransferase